MLKKCKIKPGTLIIKPKKITALNFKKYGCIIKWQGPENKKQKNQFRIVVRDKKVIGWRIAYLIVKVHEVSFMEKHPFSFESFEPVKGKAILYVSKGQTPKAIDAFILDKPVVLGKGVWHNVLSCTGQTHIKITENNKVKLIKYKLPKILKAEKTN